MTFPTKIHNSFINQFSVVQWKCIHFYETHYVKEVFKRIKQLLSGTFACYMSAHHFNEKVNCTGYCSLHMLEASCIISIVCEQ